MFVRRSQYYFLPAVFSALLVCQPPAKAFASGSLLSRYPDLEIAVLFAPLVPFLLAVLKFYPGSDMWKNLPNVSAQDLSLAETLVKHIALDMKISDVRVCLEHRSDAHLQVSHYDPNRNQYGKEIYITSGLLSILNHDELRAVLARELSEFNEKTTLSSVASGTCEISSILAAVAGSAFSCWTLLSARTATDRILYPLTGSLVTFVLTDKLWKAGNFFQKKLEFARDETAARYCGNALTLASALEKIDAHNEKIYRTISKNDERILHLRSLHEKMIAGRQSST